MILRRLRLADFRSYSHLTWEPSPGMNVILGANGSGKTNLLEAVALLAGLRLRPAARDRDLVREGAGSLRVDAALAGDEGGEHEVSLQLSPQARRYLLDGRATRAGAEGTPAAVAFTPDDLELVKGAPEARRRLLERDLAQVSLAYRDLLRRYGRALAQRNALLRAMGEGRAGEGELAPWDEAVATLGAGVQAFRRRVVDALSPRVAAGYRRLAGEGHRLEFAYRPCIDAAGAAEGAAGTEEELLRALRTARTLERARGHTLVGPHRDDLAFRLDGREMRAFASQGEQRSAVVCVKIALLEYLGEVRADRPLLVLDDVLSELDASRQERLLEAAKGHQAFVSSTAAPPVAEAAVVRTERGGLRAWPGDEVPGDAGASP